MLFRSLLRISLPLLIMSGSYVALGHIDTIMLGYYEGTNQVALYSSAVKTVLLIGFALNAINTVGGPQISHFHALNDTVSLQKILSATAWCAFCLSIPMCIILFFFGDMILGIFGNSFLEARQALMILMVGQLINSLAGAVGTVLAMTGYHDRLAIIMGFSVILNVVLNMTFIPMWGITGAAFASSITMVSWNCIMVYLVIKKNGLNPTIFPLKSFLIK